MPQPGRSHQLLTVGNRGKLHAPSAPGPQSGSGTIVETSVASGACHPAASRRHGGTDVDTIGEEMNDKQRERIESRLLEERQRTVRALRELGADLEEDGSGGELSHYPTHPADRGSENQEEEVDIALAQRQREQLLAIDSALMRLRESPDDFDRSVVSGRRIPFERLDLIPWTRVLADEDPSSEEPGRTLTSPGETEADVRTRGKADE
jgi:RNA polymerase-binding transcription factor DksA